MESYRDFETRTILDFRTEAVSSGEAVRRYLSHAQNLATASAAGRGFEGALQLLRDPELLDQGAWLCRLQTEPTCGVPLMGGY